MRSCYWVFKYLFFVIFKLYNRLEVFDEDRIPGEGGVLLVSNHVSYLDPLLVGAAIKRRCTYMARQGLFNIPLIGTFVASFSFPVSRSKPQPSTIKEAVRRLKAGELIVMFPQGGRSANGDLSDFKRGVGVVARLAGVPVVPAFLEGTDMALPVGGKMLSPAKIRVRFGEPILMKNGTNEEIASTAMEAVRELKSSGQGGRA